MNEINNIVKQFTDLQHGECWIGVNFKEALHEVNAATAAKKISGEINSVWQLVNHIIYWRNTVVIRLNGSNDRPPFVDFLLPETLDEEHWKQTLHDFEAAYHQLRSAIHNFKEEQLHKPSVKAGQTNFELLVGSLQHDAYHLGQIVLLKKLILNYVF
ncbi:MAG: DinB family protein [Ferruginibacter sp.]